jgi:cellulose synthase/poly-beta-1,6-N-acetylglucosamine synthase-like glycosyltransferase
LINTILAIVFLTGVPFFLYGIYYLFIGLLGYRRHNRYPQHPPQKRLAAVIAARNEEQVIAHLVETLKKQQYPQSLLDIFVIPNNCTDDTETAARAAGAKIFTCTKPVKSKGDALEQFFDYIFEENDHYDAFCVFDADNLVEPGFMSAMNNALCEGETIAQGYRDSKNPAGSWISGCQSIFYWTLNRFLNLARHSMGWSAALNGTGFMVSREVLADGGFRTFTLTEDIEFTTQNIIKGRRVAWVPEAITFDEHPIAFETSWKQRKRWSTGTIQCFAHYAPILWENYKDTKQWTSLDMILYLAAPFVQVATFLYTIFSFVILGMIYVNTQVWSSSLTFAILMLVLGVSTSILFSVMVVKLEGHQLKQVNLRSFFSFWFFLFSWIFINVLCFYRPIKTWEPIEHTQGVKLSQIKHLQTD